MNKITVAGTMAVDSIKIVEHYPNKGMLEDIIEIRRNVGGCVPNVALDLKKIDPSFHISVIGKIGDDDSGRYIKSTLSDNGIDISGIQTTKTLLTSYTDVITEKKGDRTFFHLRGANAAFTIDDIPIDTLDCDHFHIGYLLLLDSLDAKDEQYETKMANLLDKVQKKGITTSIDVVSENRNRYQEIVIPSLRYTDYVIINEIEAERITGVILRDQRKKIALTSLEKALAKLIQLGAKKAFIHSPEIGSSMDCGGKFTYIPSLEIDEASVKGTVGAGDAFCAGVLYGLAKAMSDEMILRFASATAAFCILQEDSTSGIQSEQTIWNFERKAKRRKL